MNSSPAVMAVATASSVTAVAACTSRARVPRNAMRTVSSMNSRLHAERRPDAARDLGVEAFDACHRRVLRQHIDLERDRERVDVAEAPEAQADAVRVEGFDHHDACADVEVVLAWAVPHENSP
jgi:hypothetical protein